MVSTVLPTLPSPSPSPSPSASPTVPPTSSRALAALCAVASIHQVACDPTSLAHRLGLAPSAPVSIDDILRAARLLGLKARRVRTTPLRLANTPLPALAVCRSLDGSDPLRLVVVAKADAQRVLLQEPGVNANRPTIETMEQFAQHWTGELLLVTSRAQLVGQLARFDYSWFVPSLVRHRRLLAEVLSISFMLQLFALVSPLFFQVVMDKVLVQRA